MFTGGTIWILTPGHLVASASGAPVFSELEPVVRLLFVGFSRGTTRKTEAIWGVGPN